MKTKSVFLLMETDWLVIKNTSVMLSVTRTIRFSIREML